MDFKLRQKLLKELQALEAKGDQSIPPLLLSSWRDGRVKLFVTYKALQTRKENSDVFFKGEYLPLKIVGPKKEHVIAFARRLEQQWTLVLAGRFFSRLTEPEVPPIGKEIWHDTFLELPKGAPREWLDKFTGMRMAGTGPKLALTEVFSNLTVALLSDTS